MFRRKLYFNFKGINLIFFLKEMGKMSNVPSLDQFLHLVSHTPFCICMSKLTEHMKTAMNRYATCTLLYVQFCFINAEMTIAQKQYTDDFCLCLEVHNNFMSK